MSNIIEYAKAYNFEKIKECVENGEDINYYEGLRGPAFYEFLDSYYTSIDFFSEEQHKMFHSDIDDDAYEQYIEQATDLYNALDLPLEDRKGNIVEKLDWFINNGADINCRGEGFVPLTIPVGYSDYYMTKYLLEHNANPKLWISSDGENAFDEPYETWYFDDCDIALLGDGFPSKERIREVIKFTALLAKYINEDYVGLSGLKVNSRKRIVSYRQISKYHY